MLIKAPNLPFRFSSQLGELELNVHTIKADEIIDHGPKFHFDGIKAWTEPMPKKRVNLIHYSAGVITVVDPMNELPSVPVTNYSRNAQDVKTALLSGFKVSLRNFEKGTKQRKMVAALLKAPGVTKIK